ncbi:MAG: radical SAM protein [Candidatus Cloacimonetes bacterium]|nr:radical SAM protein [Candidatus Cloacimonadota bacterium]
MKYKHLFGPVQSRRLGFSLGVDLVPFKYCPLNCVYCEVQSTDHLTLERREFFPLQEITDELADFLKDQPKLDYMTFSGAGEPTLYSRIGDIVRFIKDEFPGYKLALLTNGTLLNNSSLRQEILPCDLILPSLDACRQQTFKIINQPHPELTAAGLVEALVALRNDYHGLIWLEVFIIAGINDSEEELACLCEAIGRIRPDLVQINSLDRPGAEAWVQAAGDSVLNKVLDYFSARLGMPVEIIAKAHQANTDLHVPEDIEATIAATLKRRPSTAEDLSSSLGLHINEISKFLRQLHGEGKVSVRREHRGIFYSWKQ